MSESTDIEFLLAQRGTSHALGAWVIGLAFGREGRSLHAGLGDGTVRVAQVKAPAEWLSVEAHKGAVLSLCADAKDGAITGGDDGRVMRIAPDGTATELAKFGSKWVEHVVAHDSGIRAASVAKAVHVLDAKGGLLKSLAHPSTVGGIAFDAKGKRVAASHYNGASLWFVNAKEDKPRLLDWKGSHAAIAIHPEGGHVVTAMQEMSLHGWRLADGQHMRMSGYPSKTHSLSFTSKGKWLATSGAEAVVLWPFFGGGPMGKAPTELAGGDGVMCTQVACHPQHEMVAAGFEDGLVLLADINTGRVLPVAPPGQGGVSALAWNPSGSHLAFGTESGFVGLLDLSRPMSTPILSTAKLTIPALGLGTWPMRGPDCEAAVESALGLGYRHIDTAEMYGNEAEVGAGIAASGIPRGEIFLTTKIWYDKPDGPAFRAAFAASLDRLKQPHVDLLLVHWPSPALNLPSVLTALAEIHAAGLAKAVGVSNFPSALLRQALALDIAPIACLQVEQHVMLDQQTLLDITQPAGIVMTSYTPLGKGEVLEHPVLTAIAARHGATPAQVALAWLLAKPLVAAVPKAQSAARQAENLAAARLVLTAEDLAALAGLPKNRRFVNPGFAPAWDSPPA